jgi:hypothetical protein
MNHLAYSCVGNIQDRKRTTNYFSRDWEVNKDEISKHCNWIIQNGTKEDFGRFILIFDLLIKIKNAS